MDRQSVPPLDCLQDSQSPTQELWLSLFQKEAQMVPPEPPQSWYRTYKTSHPFN